MSYDQIAYVVADRVATIKLNRPESRNGYTVQMADELADAFVRADLDDDIRVVILTGSGKDFCVGADLGGGSLNLSDDTGDDASWVEPATRAVRPMFNLNKPVIAAVRGAAVGVGSTLILAADFRLAASDSRFGFVFSRRGIYPEGGSSWFLPRLVGLGRAMDWMISGRLIHADEALNAGLVNSVHDPQDVLQHAYALAHDLIATTAPVSTAVIRKALYRMSALDSPESAFVLDSRLIASCASSSDAVEGISAFLQRRKPLFSATVSKNLPDFLPWRTDKQ